MNRSTDPQKHRPADPSTWVDEHGDYLYRYALSRLRDANAAEEVVQQSFLAALKHLQQFSGRGSLRAWLLGILKRKVIDYVRQRNRASYLSDEAVPEITDRLFGRNGSWTDQIRATGWKAFDSLEREEFWQILKGCLQGLPNRQADVFVLREMDDKSTEDICKVLEISPSNLWVLLHRLFRSIRGVLCFSM
jgi:RNA polymerase sigma-70 factor (ECF subfamily)